MNELCNYNIDYTALMTPWFLSQWLLKIGFILAHSFRDFSLWLPGFLQPSPNHSLFSYVFINRILMKLELTLNNAIETKWGPNHYHMCLLVGDISYPNHNRMYIKLVASGL